MMKERLQLLQIELGEELKKILEYWESVSLDKTQGSWRTLGCDNQPLVNGYRSGVLMARVLWSWSSAYRMTGDPHMLEMAEHAWQDFRTHFCDTDNGGIYEGLTAQGEPASLNKEIYTQSYAVYALSEFYLASKKEECLGLAMKIFVLIEQHAYVEQTGGYIAHLDQNWQDLGGTLMLDTYLHLTEAYTILLKASGSEQVKQSLKRLVTLLITRWERPEGALYQELTREWLPTADLSDRYGDDAEGCWMVLKAAYAIGDTAFTAQVEEAALQLAGNLAGRGYDTGNGGVYDRLRTDGSTSENKMWWEESETVIALFYAYRIGRTEELAKKALETWAFIRDHICTGDGSWNWMVTPEGALIPTTDPSDPLMCPYHSVRIVTHCNEVIEALLAVSPEKCVSQIG